LIFALLVLIFVDCMQDIAEPSRLSQYSISNTSAVPSCPKNRACFKDQLSTNTLRYFLLLAHFKIINTGINITKNGNKNVNTLMMSDVTSVYLSLSWKMKKIKINLQSVT
jgi:hypothetical protein